MDKSVVEAKILEQNQTRKILDMLRRTRKSRGGTGAPLQTEDGKDVSPIIITDDDLKPIPSIEDL